MAYTYIKKSIKDYYVTFDDTLDLSIYNNIGSTYQDFLNGKWVLLSNKQVQFHKEHPYCSIEEVLQLRINEKTLDEIKAKVIQDIDKFDTGLGVNQFYILVPLSEEEIANRIKRAAELKKELGLQDDLPVETTKAISAWLTPEERSNYKNSVDSAKLLDVTNLQLFIGNIPLTISTEKAAQMLASIQFYADTCYVVTKNHKLNVEALKTIEEIKNYNFRKGYPKKLYFKV